METKENIYIHAITKTLCNLNYCKLVMEHIVNQNEEEIKETVSSEINKIIEYLLNYLPEEYEE